MLSINGVTLPAPLPSDGFEVVVDGRGEVSVVLLDVRGHGARPAALVDAALDAIREALLARAPIYELVSSLRDFCALEREVTLGLSLIRFSQPDSRVEVLNAGMPPIACVQPGARLDLHVPLSGAIGERSSDAHAYELSPLVWGSVWFALSDGMTRGSLEPDDVQALLNRHELTLSGRELAGAPNDELRARVARIASLGGTRPDKDATLLAISADATHRFESSILAR